MTFSGALLLSVARLVGEKGITKYDFEAAAGWNREFGFGLQDHNRACSFLLEAGFLSESEGRLFRGDLSVKPWLLDGIKSGDPDFEAFLELGGFRGRAKFESRLRSEIGLIGELHIMSLLREKVDPDLVYRIDHVALSDDTAGFDIRTPSVSGVWEEVCLEVKTSTRGFAGHSFYLSRNEAAVGATMSNWFLVFVSIANERPKLLGHLPFAEIRSRLPSNLHQGFVWTEVMGKVLNDDLYPGLP